MHRVMFVLLPKVEILDLAGPLTVFHEANELGHDFEIMICAEKKMLELTPGLRLSDLRSLSDVEKGDIVIIPGVPVKTLNRVDVKVTRWLIDAYKKGARIYAICTGAFVLGEAGLLEGRQCTTHWKRTEQLQRKYARAKVLENRLCVEDRGIITSAGMTSGIDLALSIVEQHCGPRKASAVAREMVVYIRRDASQKQDSVYLDHRGHFNPGIHRVQDILISEPDRRHTLRDLARVGNMSERNLTRVFRENTGISIGEYVSKLRLELAKALLADPFLTVEAIANRCGFQTARQLRRLSKKFYGSSIGELRSRHVR